MLRRLCPLPPPHDSPWGRTLRAIRDNEDSARAVGKDVEWFRLQTFVIGAALMGVAGGLSSAIISSSCRPAATEPLLVTFLVWVMLMAGGSGNNQGRHCRRARHLGASGR